ncbi:DUF3618 domain-containing protein [Allostreptomyces psammosilenae]|uniref:DUF3618 domain-containing protein n=1 Tax=Allostreptomyces psammosilenae TaxID=1892865 RepID=A0A853ACH0_9ACTN|nr:DUF3618 domain-containing protein [Allostreptomyces psammosilenae]NYI08158.1 hypothetical protein [Allostreptomyces psammosilenae]
MSEVKPHSGQEAPPPDVRTPAEIEADINRTRRRLAATLDELAVRVHPRTVVDDAKDRAREAVSRGVGRARTVVGEVGGRAREQVVDDYGGPRLERVVPLALVGLAVVTLLAVSAYRRRR